jgi:hypothetical protein
MIRARKLSNVHKKRSIRPLYSHHQATPYAAFLDTASVGTTVVSPGMVARQVGASERMGLCNATQKPFGLFANFINGDMDELGDGTEIGVWLGGKDATFEVLSDALEADSWTGAAAADTAVYSSANSKLTLTGAVGTNPVVARLMEAPSNNKIIIRLVLGALAADGWAG